MAPGHVRSLLGALVLFLVCAMFIILCQVKLASSVEASCYVCLVYSCFLKFDPGGFYMHMCSFGWKRRSAVGAAAGVQSQSSQGVPEWLGTGSWEGVW